MDPDYDQNTRILIRTPVLRTERCCPGPGGGGTDNRCPADFNMDLSKGQAEVSNGFSKHYNESKGCRAARERGAQPFTNEYFKSQANIYNNVKK